MALLALATAATTSAGVSSLVLAGQKHGGQRQRAAAIAGCDVSEILDFSASLNPLGPPASVLAAIQAQLTEVAHYPDPSYQALRAAIATYYQLDPDWICVGNGAAELLTWAARDREGVTLLPQPGFSDYARAVGSSISYYPAATPPLTTAASIWLNTPHNPTGALLSGETLSAIADHYRDVVVDEAFMDFVTPAPSLLHAYCEHVVVVRSLTKFWAIPGLRVGFAVAHPDRWRQWCRDPWPVNALAIAGAIAALGDSDFRDRTLAWLPPTRQHLIAQLAALPGLTPYPSEANFVLVKSDFAVPLLQDYLLRQHRILIRDCLSFAGLGEHYFRVAVRTDTENQTLINAIALWLATTP